ncbi:helix-turn-helix domain-containing protein [Candidatus Pacearchaeota archaeon]|nr:helix-turn-helix domain-containing protein [Candidatus Pacearchaeota archaeon]
MSDIELNKLYTIGEAANFLRVTEKTVRRKIKENKIGHIFDGTYLIPGNLLLEYLENHLQRASES